MIPERQNNGPMNHENLIKLIDSRIPVIKTWKDEISGIKSNKEVYKQYGKFREKIWRYRRNIWRRKVAIGYLYYHKFIQNKLIIAEKIQITS